jgi:hypothetical protein
MSLNCTLTTKAWLKIFCCGSRSGSSRIRNFWSGPNPEKSFRIQIPAVPDPRINDKLRKCTISQQNAQLKKIILKQKNSIKKLEAIKKLGLHLQKLIFRRNFRNKVRVCRATLFRQRLIHAFHAGSEIRPGSGSGIWIRKTIKKSDPDVRKK